VVLERFGQVAVPETAVRDGEVLDAPAVTAALRELWASTRFTHKRVALGVANQRVVVRQVDLPGMPLADLASALPFQVQDLLPMPVESAVLDFHPLEAVTGSGGTPLLRGLLVAAARDMVMANVRAVEAAGLTVTSVDLTPFAVLRSVGTRLAPDVETEALVDIGARVTNIVVHSGGAPRFVRILLMGGQDLTDAVSEHAGLPMTEAEELKQRMGLASTSPEHVRVSQALVTSTQALLDEVRSSLDYYTSTTPTHPVDRLVMTGGGSRLQGLAERLAAATRLPVSTGDPLAPLAMGSTGLDADQLALVGPLAAVPVGLALGAAQ
jgi:type IV pilus assembly protein PilM